MQKFGGKIKENYVPNLKELEMGVRRIGCVDLGMIMENGGH